MRLEYQILAAAALDLLLGDPRWLPHPVRGIGWLAARLETFARWAFRGERLAGVVTALTIYCVAGLVAWGVVQLATRVHPWAGDAVAIVVIYTTIAARDLTRHSAAVYDALMAGDLPESRRRVALIVGRDTEQLEEPDVVRAAVESVAESAVDGVTAPLFFAVLGGPAAAMVYRAINTLDSMFGHQDERYCRFGWAAARIDDLANYLPARLTAPLVCVASFLLRGRAANAAKILLRDRHRHASPNSGLTEAAMAGALGVQLGGMNYYAGEPHDKPTLGDPLVPLTPQHIRRANALMLVTAGLFLAICLAARAGAVQLLELV